MDRRHSRRLMAGKENKRPRRYVEEMEETEPKRRRLTKKSGVKMQTSQNTLIEQPREGVAESEQALIEQPQEGVSESEQALFEQPQERVAESEQALIEQPQEVVAESEQALIEQPQEEVGESEQALIAQPQEGVAELEQALIEQPQEEVGESEQALIAQPQEGVAELEQALIEQPQEEVGESEQAVERERFREIAQKISCAMALVPSRCVGEVMGEAEEFLRKLLATQDTTFLHKITCDVRIVLGGKSPKIGVNAVAWRNEEDDDKIEDSIRPHLLKKLGAAVWRLENAPQTAAYGGLFRAALEALRKTIWANTHGLAFAILMTMKPTGLNSLRNVQLDENGHHAPICIFCSKSFRNFKKKRGKIQSLDQALKQAQDHFDASHKKNFAHFKEKCEGFENKFLTCNFGDTIISEGPNFRDWAEAVLIAHTKWGPE